MFSEQSLEDYICVNLNLTCEKEAGIGVLLGTAASEIYLFGIYYGRIYVISDSYTLLATIVSGDNF